MRDLKQLRRKIEVSFEPRQLLWIGIAVVLLVIVSFYAGMFAAHNSDVQRALALARAEKLQARNIPPQPVVAIQPPRTTDSTSSTPQSSALTPNVALKSGIDEAIDAYSKLEKSRTDTRTISPTTGSPENWPKSEGSETNPGATPLKTPESAKEGYAKVEIVSPKPPEERENLTAENVDAEVMKELRGETTPKKKSPPKQRIAGIPQFTLQIASYKDEASAKKVEKRLKDAGVKANVIQKEIGGVVWYRVRYGAYVRREEAARDIELIKSRAATTPIVTKIGN